MAYIVKTTQYRHDLPFAYPIELADRVEEGRIAPAGCSIMSSCFLVNKYDVAVCDGQDNWYIKSGRCIKAGQPWSDLYAT